MAAVAAARTLAKKGLAATLVIGYQFTVFSLQKIRDGFAAIAIAERDLRANDFSRAGFDDNRIAAIRG